MYISKVSLFEVSLVHSVRFENSFVDNCYILSFIKFTLVSLNCLTTEEPTQPQNPNAILGDQWPVEHLCRGKGMAMASCSPGQAGNGPTHAVLCCHLLSNGFGWYVHFMGIYLINCWWMLMVLINPFIPFLFGGLQPPWSLEEKTTS